MPRPLDLHKTARVEQYKLSERQRRRLTDKILKQLCECRSEAARRILLGVSR